MIRNGSSILGAGDEKEAEDIIIRFRPTDAAAEVICHVLKGPFEDGSNSPFLVAVTADNVTYEQMRSCCTDHRCGRNVAAG